jgi:hypothetical protein
MQLAELEQPIKEAQSLAEITIKNNEDNAKASAVLRGLRGLKDNVKETFRPHIQKAHSSWKALISEEKKHLEPIERCEVIIEGKILQFTKEENERRLKLQAEIEAKAQKEREKLEKQAQKAIENGNFDKAEEKLQQSQMVITPVIETKAEKQEGVSTVKVWKFSIIDEKLIPKEFLIVDESLIRKTVNTFKDKASIPGVKIWCEDDLRVRR